MWPFSKIRALEDDLAYWRSMSEEQARLLNESLVREKHLRNDLKIARRNDTPRDEKTGRFRKTP